MNAEQRQLTRLYVAGKLSEAESEAFEEYCVAHPQFAQEVELEQRLAAGLKQAAGAAKQPSAPSWIWAAAAGAVLALGGLVFTRQTWLGGPALITAGSAETPSSAFRLRLARTRGNDTPPIITSPGTIALEVIGQFDPQARYGITLTRHENDGETLVAELANQAPVSDTALVTLLDTQRLPAGTYTVSVHGGGDTPSYQFKKP